MGSCVTSLFTETPPAVIYPSSLTLHLSISKKSIEVSLPPPVFIQSQSFQIGEEEFRYSACVIAGIHPHADIQKDCQDTVMFMQAGNEAVGFLLMDGHGSEGKALTLECTKILSHYFQHHSSEFQLCPMVAIRNSIKDCDAQLKSPRNSTFAASGSTLVYLYLYEGKVVAGSVGDSRAVLGTRWEMLHPMPVHSQNSYYRRVEGRPVKAIRLTIDQKPHHLGEKERIEAAGGRVSRVEDDDGTKSGPYRVMSIYGLAPGLAMSRALGDKLGSDVGVISEPLIHTFPLYPSRDRFIVIASDGLWDVMTNEEVVCFIDIHMPRSPKDLGKMKAIQKMDIAQMLCEEARYRWMGLVEKEEIVVDDISCIVIQLPEHPTGSDFFGFIDDRELPPPVSLESTIAVT